MDLQLLVQKRLEQHSDELFYLSLWADNQTLGGRNQYFYSDLALRCRDAAVSTLLRRAYFEDNDPEYYIDLAERISPNVLWPDISNAQILLKFEECIVRLYAADLLESMD